MWWRTQWCGGGGEGGELGYDPSYWTTLESVLVLLTWRRVCRKSLYICHSGRSFQVWNLESLSSPSVWPPPRRGFSSPRLGEGRGSLRPSHSELLLTSCQLHQSHAGEMATERRRGFRTASQSVNQAALTRPHLVCSIIEPQRAPTSM